MTTYNQLNGSFYQVANADANLKITELNAPNLNVSGESNLGAVANVTITGGSNGQYLQTDGSGNLQWASVDASAISNGNSNVRIATANGNVTVSVTGVENVVTVSNTGANISGTLGVTGNANAGNIGVTGVVATTLGGTLTTAAQPNITSVGTLTSLTVNGTSNLGPVGNVTITGGSSGYVLTTDGSGTLSWTDPTAPAGLMKVDSTSLVFNSGATVSAFTLPINAIVDTVSIIVDTAFNGTSPTVTVGLNGGSTTVYAESGDSDLKTTGRYDIPSQVAPVGTTGGIELYYTASGSTAGAGRVVITYSTPA